MTDEWSERPATFGAIILAAGRSQRMGGVDKLLAPLAGRPLIAHSIATFAAHPRLDAIVVVVSEDNLAAVSSVASDLAPRASIARGGPRRRDSVLAGLQALPDCDYIVVHDGARPLLTTDLIDGALQGATEVGAALCAVPATDTLKRADEAGIVRETLPRGGLWLAQTPQAFRADVLRRAHAGSDIDATDDCALVELLGEPVRVVPGSSRNLKITITSDLGIAEALLLSTSRALY